MPHKVPKCDIILQTFPFEPSSSSCDIHSCCKNVQKFPVTSTDESKSKDREVSY